MQEWSLLLAIAAIPFRWGSALRGVEANSGWADVFIAVAAVAWGVEKARTRRLGCMGAPWALAGIAFVGWGAISAGVRGQGWSTVATMGELLLLAVLTAECAVSEGRGRIVVAVTVSAGITLMLGVAGLGLFYAGVHSGLVGVYGEQLSASSIYARVQAGFTSPPLMGSWCIFAAGVIALRRERARGWDLALLLACGATVSRALLGYLTSLGLRRLKAPGRAVAVAAGATLIVGALTVGALHVDPSASIPLTYRVPDPGNRREAAVTAWHTFVRHPLFGLGPGALPALNRGHPFRAHLTPLNIAATMGLPALCAFCVLLILLWRARRRPTNWILWGTAIGLAIDGLAQDVDHFRHVWALIGLLAGWNTESPAPTMRVSQKQCDA